jgi:hypothetical protein
LDTYKLLKITLGEIVGGVSTIRDYSQDLYSKLRDLIDKLLYCQEIPRFGINHKEVMDRLGKPEQFIYEILEIIDEVEKMTEDYEFLNAIKHEHADNLISTNFLKDFLLIYTNQKKGAFTVGKDFNLSILTYNEDVLKTLENSGFTIYQDATGSVVDLAYKINQPTTSIIECKFKPFDNSNLEIVNVTGLGKANKNRSDLCDQKINALKEEFNRRHNNNIGFIDWKCKASKGELNHFADGRGSNDYQTKEAIASFGAPYSNLSALAQEYTLWTREVVDISEPTIEFERLINDRLSGEIIQEIGRLRSNRRPDQKLTYYICSDIDVEWLSKLGYLVRQVTALSIAPDAGSRGQQTAYKIFKAVEKLTDINNSTIAKFINLNRTTVSKKIKELGGLDSLIKYVYDLLYGEKIITLEKSAQWFVEEYLTTAIDSGADFWEDVSFLLKQGITFGKIIKSASLTARVKLLEPILELVPEHIRDRIVELTNSKLNDPIYI